MNLLKKIRKNRNKVIAVVVIVIFIGFVGQQFFAELSRRRTSPRVTIARFGDNGEITNYDLNLARRDLGILKLLQADKILRNINVPMFSVNDLQALLLAELLFSDRTISPALILYIRQMIGASQYRISEKQINDIYRRPMPSEMYWLLLKNEAQAAGVKTSNEVSGMQLAKIIPQFFDGATYSQVIGSIVNQQGVSEEEILTTFSELTTILMYARMMCTNEDVTSSQIMHNASWEAETISVEFVRFDSAVFAETAKEPSEEELVEQFDKYKKFFPGDINDQNPYGFGYKLDNMVQLEYIAVKLDEIAATVAAPTQEEAEEFYQKHREEFTVSVPSDQNDPYSTQNERIQSYGEVADSILKNLRQNKINSEAEKILQEARTLTEAGLQATDMELDKISADQFRQMAGDYVAVAKQLSEKYKIKVYAGRTGLLSASDILADKYLRTMFLRGHGYNPLLLARAVFAVDELAASELGPFDIPKPKLYENIGPAKDIFGQIMVVVRVIKAEKASEPESINQTFSKDSLKFDDDQEQPEENVYSVRKAVAEDLKKLSAMGTTKNKAEEFVQLAVSDGWESAVDKFNNLYKQPDNQAVQDVNVFKLQSFTNLQRASSMLIETVALQSAGNPAGRQLFDKAARENDLIFQLYSLIPQDSNTIDTLPLVVEFKPDVSYYCLKSISVNRLEQEQYDKIKPIQDYKEDFIESQSMAPVHFNPENIVKRMNFRQVKGGEEPADINMPSEPQGGL
jgi:hypothetical protein